MYKNQKITIKVNANVIINNTSDKYMHNNSLLIINIPFVWPGLLSLPQRSLQILLKLKLEEIPEVTTKDCLWNRA